MPRPADLLGVHLPHCIEGVFERDDDTERAEQKNDGADGGRQQTLLRMARAGQHGLDRLRRGIAEKPAQLQLHFAAAASSPNTRPATAMAMTITGPSENTE